MVHMYIFATLRAHPAQTVHSNVLIYISKTYVLLTSYLKIHGIILEGRTQWSKALPNNRRYPLEKNVHSVIFNLWVTGSMTMEKIGRFLMWISLA
jgi:hypothetical protein